MFFDLKFILATEINISTYLKQILICTGVIFASWLISMVSVTFIALVLTKLGKVMSWYARPAWLFFLYICPTIAASMLWFLYAAGRQKNVSGTISIQIIMISINNNISMEFYFIFSRRSIHHGSCIKCTVMHLVLFG